MSFKLSGSDSQQPLQKFSWFHHICQRHVYISSVSEMMNFVQTDEVPEQVRTELGT